MTASEYKRARYGQGAIQCVPVNMTQTGLRREYIMQLLQSGCSYTTTELSQITGAPKAEILEDLVFLMQLAVVGRYLDKQDYRYILPSMTKRKLEYRGTVGGLRFAQYSKYRRKGK